MAGHPFPRLPPSICHLPFSAYRLQYQPASYPASYIATTFSGGVTA